MRSADLEAEARANFQRLSGEDVRQLVELGIDPVLVMTGLIGADRIRHKDGLYERDPLGKLAYLTPVRVQRPRTPESTNPYGFTLAGDIIDIVAWAPGSRDFALRCGNAAWLGLVEPQVFDPFPIRVWRSVLGWLRADLSGIVLLTDDPAEARLLLAGATGLIPEDPEHGDELHRLLSRPALDVPRILVPNVDRDGE